VEQVTKPDLPHVDRAAHRVTLPLQFVGRPFATACFTACATQLTYCPWLVEASQTQVLAMLARTVAAMAGSEHRAAAVPTMKPPEKSHATIATLSLNVMSTSFGKIARRLRPERLAVNVKWTAEGGARRWRKSSDWTCPHVVAEFGRARRM
jgi:hypothetical protein